MSSTRNSKIRTLQRAVEAFGGANSLATHLDVKLSQLKDWVGGRVEVPPEVFGAALDIVAAGPFAAWSGDEDEKVASRGQAHANRLQQIADRIKARAERAQLTADQAQRRVLEGAKSGQDPDRPAEQPSGKLVGEKSTDK